MKTVLLTGIRQLEIREVPEPKLTHPAEVILRIDAVGVCGSDIHYYRTGRIGSQVIKFPATLGHECAGTVISVGGAVTDLQKGHRVAIDPLISCGECDQCLEGRVHTCRNQSFLGCPGQAPGGLAEYVSIPAKCCYPVPDSMSMAEAAMVEPFSIALHAQRLASPQPGARIGILGSGPIGLCVLLACRAVNSCTTFLTDLLDERLEIAKSCGADWTGDASHVDVKAALTKLEPTGLDIVFECAGKQETLDQALELLKPGGTLVIVGIPELDRVSFDIHLLRRNELSIRNVRRQNECVIPAIGMISSGAVNLKPLLTHELPFSQTKRAIDLVANYDDGVMKAIIQVSNHS